MNQPAGGRTLGGDAGYKRLVRLLGRAFYAGECPPKEAEEEVPAGARSTRRDKVRTSASAAASQRRFSAAVGTWQPSPPSPSPPPTHVE